MTADVVGGRMGGPVRRLRHGSWTLEIRGDEVSEIRYDGVYLLRAIRPVVRDRDWNTVPVEVVAQQPLDDGTRVVTHLRFAADGIAYEATVGLRLGVGERGGDLTVEFDGRALVGFERNRIGLVVLHPAADAGRAVDVAHTDGRVTAGSWPTAISPHQPFRDVAGFAWSTDGVAATLTLTGDVFETEDQRNWTDSSFKTYSTPLDRPFPVAVPPGGTCRQSVRLTAAGRSSRPVTTLVPDEVTITDEVVGRLPPISIGASLYPPPSRPPALGPGFETVLVELTGDVGRWPEHIDAAARQAGALGAALDVRIVTEDEEAVDGAVALLAGYPVVRVAAFDERSHISTPPLWKALRDSTRRHGLGAQLVGGTRAHFTELNRQIRNIPSDVPALTFSVTPQMHATEVPHIVESLSAQPTVTGNALRLAEGRPVFLGPVTLARRFNAVATTAAADPAVEAERATDPLQPCPFTAAWTVGSVAALATTGVAGLCYFEITGPRGVVGADGAPTPAGRVLADLAGLRGRPVLHRVGPSDIPVLAVVADDGAVEVLIANLSAGPRTVGVTRGGSGHQPVVVDAWSAHRMRWAGAG
jgi:hypothetical protein